MNRMWQKLKEWIDLGFVVLILIPLIWVFIKLSNSKEGFWWDDE